jgi:hypothetical protein
VHITGYGHEPVLTDQAVRLNRQILREALETLIAGQDIEIMRKNLPSLSALYAFEATARHLSFSRAAIELNLTQGAISQRIRALEEFLGDKVFVRENNTIRLRSWSRPTAPSAVTAATN